MTSRGFPKRLVVLRGSGQGLSGRSASLEGTGTIAAALAGASRLAEEHRLAHGDHGGVTHSPLRDRVCRSSSGRRFRKQPEVREGVAERPGLANGERRACEKSRRAAATEAPIRELLRRACEQAHHPRPRPQPPRTWECAVTGPTSTAAADRARAQRRWASYGFGVERDLVAWIRIRELPTASAHRAVQLRPVTGGGHPSAVG